MYRIGFERSFFDDVSDVVDQMLADDLREVENLIHQQNEDAVKNPRYRTVVYLSHLSSWDAASYRSELEQLRGIAVAQKGRMADRPVRVLLVNGGGGMDGGAAAEAIVREADEDDTLVAVVGLGTSRTGTRDAIARLTKANIPVIGASISTTNLAANTNPYYHKVAPTSQRAAEVGAFYIDARLGARSATIYYSDDEDDLYSNDLRDQAKLAFEARGLVVRERKYQIEIDDIHIVGREACDVGPDDVVFYAGRAEQLSVFLKGMQSKCDKRCPRFLGGVSVSRFVLDRGLEEFPELTIDYLAQASSLAWGPRLQCAAR
ncbi:MAG: ABC transporter substrate-binding protein [Pseudonocardiales bacterium]